MPRDVASARRFSAPAPHGKGKEDPLRCCVKPQPPPEVSATRMRFDASMMRSSTRRVSSSRTATGPSAETDLRPARCSEGARD
eukprot:3785570-Rhodomonas_salina.1